VHYYWRLNRRRYGGDGRKIRAYEIAHIMRTWRGKAVDGVGGGGVNSIDGVQK